MRVLRLAALLLAPGLAVPGLAWADGQSLVLHGNANGALPCAACHGANGGGNKAMGAPALAGLPAATMETALAQMAQGQGGNAMMQSIARALSPAEMHDAATYFSALPKP